MQTLAQHVDLPRYMGAWYVIASIPSPLEKDAFNAIERYELDTNGTVKTTFTCRKGSFDGKPRTVHARGFIKDRKTNAVWGMQFFWPIKADYRIAWLADDYSQVVVARRRRDYVWIMARTPAISDVDYQKLRMFAAGLGYDKAKINKVPQEDAFRMAS
jgi:apolipoprotein D and lipocalin family protein